MYPRLIEHLKINVTHHMNRLKKENHRNLLIYIETIPDKNPIPIYCKKKYYRELE